MQILHVIRTMNPSWGGPVEGVRNIARQAARRGHKVEVTCLDAPGSAWLANLDLHVNAVGPAKFGRFGFAPQLDAWLETNIDRFEVIVVNGIWMYFSAAVRRAAKRHRVPYFVFTHGALDPWFKRYYPYKQLKKSAYWLLFEHKVLRDAAAVLFTTAEEQALSENAFWPYNCNGQVTGYGVEDPWLSHAGPHDQTAAKADLTKAFPELNNRNFLLFLARIHEKKGIDLLLEAIAQNRNSFGDRALVIAGAGDTSYLERLKTIAADLGVSNQVIWTGPIYGEMKWTALRAADAYVLPSHQENFGISIVEALACSVPVLITNKVNIWREVSAAGAGFVESDDVSGISRLLDQWAALRPEAIEKMREKARSCYSSSFDISSTCSTLFGMLQQASAR